MILTHAERTALQAVADGLGPKEYARQSWRSRHTVNDQLKSARKRLGAKTTAQAVAFAVALHEIRAHLPERAA